jgi:hypothetical protein
LLEGEHARLLVQRAYTEIKQGDLVDTYARSSFHPPQGGKVRCDGLEHPRHETEDTLTILSCC